MKSKLHPALTRLAWAVLLAAAPLAGAAAQANPTVAPPPPDTAEPARPRQAADPGDVDGPLLDAPVSRTEYLLGPGDRLGIAVVGEFNEVYTVTVTPEGSVLVPGLGITRVLGLNLEQAEERVRALVGRFYRNVEVRLALTRVRTFNVFLVGAVPSPGVRRASAATRVSEVVGSPVYNGVVRRNVVVRRAGGDSLLVDMVRFLRTGDTRANPFVREGDAVVVPTLNRWVNIYGRVHYPGTYEFRQGESLGELIAAAGGFSAEAADTTLVVRTVQGRREIHRLARSSGTLGSFAVQPFDGVYVTGVSQVGDQPVARVEGEVQHPGTYPIRSDTTTLRELVAMAGGFTPRASLALAVLERTTAQVELPDTAMLPPGAMDATERQTRRAFNAGASSHVVVNFQRLFGPGGDAYDVPVHDGDRLIVPQRTDDISVRGAVRTPGLLPYRAGMKAEHYIAGAGWYARRADVGNVVVVRPSTGAQLSMREVGALQPGDVVVVPFRERRPWNEILTRGQMLITTITSLIITGIAIARN